MDGTPTRNQRELKEEIAATLAWSGVHPDEQTVNRLYRLILNRTAKATVAVKEEVIRRSVRAELKRAGLLDK